MILSPVSFQFTKGSSHCLHKPPSDTHGSVAHPDAVDPDAGGRVHHVAGSQLGLDGRVEDGFLFLQVQDEAQLRQGEAGGPGQAEQGVVEVYRVTA